MKLSKDSVPDDDEICTCSCFAGRHNSNIGRCKDCGCQRFVEDKQGTLANWQAEDATWD